MNPTSPAQRFHPLLRLATFFGGWLLLQLVMALLVLAAIAMYASWNQITIHSEFQELSRVDALALLVLNFPPSLLWLWLCRRGLEGRTLVSLGLRTGGVSLIKLVGGGFFCGLGAVALWFLAAWLTGNASVQGWSPEAFQAGLPAATCILVMYAMAFALLGFFEELAFRGYAYHNLFEWLGRSSALVLQAVGFGLAHLINLARLNISPSDPALVITAASWGIGIINIMLIGFLFALSYHKTGSLWFAIGFHGAWNFACGNLISLPVSGTPVFRMLDVATGTQPLLTGARFGPEASLPATVIILAMVWLVGRCPDRLTTLVLDSTEPELLEPEPEPEDDEPSEPLYQTTMRPQEAGLEPETMMALRAYREQMTRPGGIAAPGVAVGKPVPAIAGIHEGTTGIEVPGMPSWEAIPPQPVTQDAVPESLGERLRRSAAQEPVEAPSQAPDEAPSRSPSDMPATPPELPEAPDPPVRRPGPRW